VRIAKDGIRSIVRIGYDGRVVKTFRGTDSLERFTNEVAVLEVLESRSCDYVPKLLAQDADTLTITTTSCGSPVEKISEKKSEELFKELEEQYGILHDDPFPRNITYDARLGRFCIIDFELATILGETGGKNESLKLHLEWSGQSKMGRRKKENEDALAIFASSGGWEAELPDKGVRDIAEEGMVLAVSDGMGGSKGGRMASSMAVRDIRKFLPAKMGDFRQIADPLGIMEDSVKNLHWNIVQKGKSTPGYEKMGATLICGLFYRAQLHFAHVGDSRIYRFRDGALEQLTHDQTMVGFYRRKGDMSEREARSHPRRHILQQVIGAKLSKVIPQVESYRVQRGDWYLWCSDGLVDGLWDRQIKNAFIDAVEAEQGPNDLCSYLVDRAWDNEGRDDTTAIVVKIS